MGSTQLIEVSLVKVDSVLAKPVMNENGDVLLNTDTKLTEKQIEYLKSINCETIIIKKLVHYSAEELEKIKQKYKKQLIEKFRYFEEGKKKDTLIKLLLSYRLRAYHG